MEKPYINIIHIGDIHTTVSRRQEQFEVKESLYHDIRTTIQNHADQSFLIVLAGDIFETKVKSAPTENIDVQDMLYNLQLLAPVIMIPGNHDLNMNKPGGPDLISPVIRDSNRLLNLLYWRESGIYKHPNWPNITFYASAPDGDIVQRENPIIREPGQLYIGIMHEEITGCLAYGYRGSGKRFDGTIVTVADFANLDLVMLGHIHERQLLTERSAYSGSLIQRNFGEHHNNHGYIHWQVFLPNNIELGRVIPVGHNIYNSRGFLTLKYKQNIDITDTPFPSTPNSVRVEYEKCDPEFIKNAIAEIESKYGKVKNVRCIDLPVELPAGELPPTVQANDREVIVKIGEQIASLEYQELLIRQLLGEHPLTEKIVELHNFKSMAFLNNDPTKVAGRRSRWKLKRLRFENMYCYGPGNEVNFEDLKGSVSGIIAPNKSGKSAFIDILLYTLFNELPRGDKGDILNHTYRDAGGAPANAFSCSAELEIDGKLATISKRIEGSGHPRVTFTLAGENLTCHTLPETYKLIAQHIGTYKDSINTIICLQSSTSSKTSADDFVHMTAEQRKGTLARLFNLNIFTDLIKDAKEEKLRMRYEAVEKEKAINSIRRGISPEALAELTAKKEETEKNIGIIQKNISHIETELYNLLNVWRDKNPVKVSDYVDALTAEELAELTNLETEEIPKQYIGIYEEIIKTVVEPPAKEMPSIQPALEYDSTLHQRLKIYNNPKIGIFADEKYVVTQLQSLGITADLKNTYYKQISNNLDYDMNKYNELLNNQVDISNHLKNIQLISSMTDGETLPANIRQIIGEYIETYKIYSTTSAELELAKNINVDSLNLNPNCAGCSNVIRLANTVSAKMEILKSCIDENNNRTKTLNEFKQLLEKQVEQTAQLSLIHNTYVANLLVGYQNWMLNELEIGELIDHHNRYNKYINALAEVEKTKSIMDQEKLLADSRRNELRTKASARRQILEFNLAQTRAAHNAAIQQLGELTASKKTMEERLAQINAMDQELYDLKAKEALYDMYQTVIDDKKGIPSLLLKKNISAFTSAINQTLAEFTDMQLEISEDIQLYVRVGGFHRAEPMVMGSGYQKFVVGMACRIALANISNTPLLDGIIIDEGFSSMDANNQDLVIDFLRELGHEHELLFIISHLDALQGAMDRSLIIERKKSPANNAEYSFIRNTPAQIKNNDRPIDFITDPEDPSKYYCQYCKRSFAAAAVNKHRISKIHLKKIEDYGR